MVSPFSARLLGSSAASISSGKSSSNGSSISGKKRPFHLTKPEDSLGGSGYSADREATTSPPVMSIDLSSRARDNRLLNNADPKRRKNNELQFAVSSVKADLARAGIEFPHMDQNLESTTKLGKVSINLNGVELKHSKEFKNTPMITSNVSSRCSSYEYQALAAACSSFYPRTSSQHMEVTSSGNQDSDEKSTSSVSDTESDSSDSHRSSQQVLYIPPLLEDSLESRNSSKQVFYSKSDGSCNIISSSSNSMTLGEVVQLSSKARLVTTSCSPYKVIYANAAFFRLAGLASGNVLGADFSSVMGTIEEASSAGTGSQPSLPDFLVLSSRGNHHLVQFKATATDSERRGHRIKVAPVVARKTTMDNEVSTVTHFAIEFLVDDGASSPPLGGARIAQGTILSSIGTSMADGVAVGVMG